MGFGVMGGRAVAAIAAASLICWTGASAAQTAKTANAVADDSYAISLFGGVLLDNTYDELLIADDIAVEGFGLFGVAGAVRVLELFDALEIELEAQVVRHANVQSHWELNAPVVARWTAFPWNDTVQTSAAFGLGLSYATDEPAREVLNEGETEQLMAYWHIELEAGPPDSPYSGFARLHHRSTAYGLFGDDGGSNAFVFGVRRRF